MKTRRTIYSHIIATAGVLVLILGLAVPAHSQTVLIDFGNASSYRGATVANPDAKGHYWNSVWSGAYYPGLLSTNGTATTWAFGFDVPGPTDSYNGPAGDTSVPGGNLTGCVFNATALGDFAITNAVYDFYVNSTFQIQGLTPGTTYTVKFYGSHKYSDSDYTVFSIYTNSAYTLLSTSGTLNNQTPGNPAAHNQDTILTLTSKPWTNGIMYVKFLGTNSSSVVGSGVGGYLNALQISSGGGGGGGCTNVGPAVANTILIDFGNNLSYRGTNTPSPDAQGHYWNSVWSGAYYPGLTKADGSASSVALGFDGVGANATDSYNGPAGDTSAGVPATIGNCVFDPCALVYLGATNAVYDYYKNPTFQINNLNPARQYSLTFFGSQKYPDDPVTVYSLCTDATYSTIITSVTLNVGSGAAHNQSQVAVISGVSPAGGNFYIKANGQSVSSSGFLECMQLVDLTGGGGPPPSDDKTKTVLIDFSDASLYRSVTTMSPDKNSNWWNSVNYNYVAALTNAAGSPTTLAYGLDAVLGYDSYNGPAGDTSVPGGNVTGCVFNATALGYLGITNAVYDYFQQTAFQIQGADPSKKYKLTFFGSHKYNTDDVTKYSLCTDAAYSTILTSVTLNVGSGALHNQDTTAVISNVAPQGDGIFYIRVEGQTTSASGYINCMSLVDLTTNVVVTPPPLAKTILLDFGANNTYRGTNTVSPDGLGHYWNNLGTNFIGNALVLTNAGGAVTAVQFLIDASNPAFTNAASGFGTDSYNGPAGDTTINGPSACVFNPGALGYLGITNAVYDFYVNAKCQIQGMDPAKTYQLTFFGSHKYNIDNTTVYSICSDATYSTVLASTNLLVGAGASHNQANVATIGPISPQPNGTMYLKFNGSGGNLGYLNCMQIVDLSTTNTPPVTNLWVNWQGYYFPGGGPSAAGGADPDGDGFSNTNEFMAGFNPLDPAAYPHIISAVPANTTNLVITYLGASGDSSWSPGIASRTNVLEYTIGVPPSGSYSNNFVSTGQTNILSGGIGGGTIASFVETNVMTGPTRYYRVRVLVP